MPLAPVDAAEILRLLLDTAPLWRKLYDRELRMEVDGLAGGRSAVDVQLARNDAIRQTGLAQILNIKASTLVRLLDRLEIAGYIRRSPDFRDRRTHIVTLTPQALAVARRISEVRNGLDENVARSITERRSCRGPQPDQIDPQARLCAGRGSRQALA